MRPISPTTVPLDMPMRVLWLSDLNTLNHSHTKTRELAVQPITCQARVSDGRKKTTAPTITAPRPNHTRKNADTASSSSIRTMPSTTQCHHRISMAPPHGTAMLKSQCAMLNESAVEHPTFDLGILRRRRKDGVADGTRTHNT